MPYHHGKRVSASHATMLDSYEKSRRRPLYINQGQRTYVEQTWFWLRYKRWGWPLAAPPWPSAPHIKAGHEHHALDISVSFVNDVAAFYRACGVPCVFNVRNEPWHLDFTDEAALKRAAAKRGSTGDPILRQGQTGPSVVRLKKLLYNHGMREFSTGASSNRYDPYFSKWTKAAVQRFQRANKLGADGIVGAATWRALRS
jgi:hypothetical protein